MDTQINSKCKTAFFHLYNIRRIRKFLNFECTKILVNAFVTSRLDFCNSLLSGLPKNQLYKLQRVQNAAARLTCNVGRFEHITPSLYMLHWLPVNYRIQFKILLFVYKALNGIAPPYISELVELKPASRYNLRNSDDTLLLNSPSFKSRITLGDRSFRYAGPQLWNELPRHVMPTLYIVLSVFSKLTCLGKLFCLECYRFNNVMIVKILMIIKIVKIINTLVLVISGL